jgi:ubiquinone biosynthesis protein
MTAPRSISGACSNGAASSRVTARCAASSAIPTRRSPSAASRASPVSARACRQPRYADAFQAIGPAAIKLGQTLATRPDLVGEEAAHDLLRLQDALPPLPFAVIRERIENSSYGRPLETFFASIEEAPVGAASIAQVHRAVTTDGRQVAVKVLRPGIEAEFAKGDRDL